MDIEAIFKALDAGSHLDEVAMLERLVRGLIAQEIRDEHELYRAAVVARA